MELTFSKIIRWIVGLLFIVAAFGAILQGSILSFLFAVLIVVVCIPPIAIPIEKKINFSMSGPVRFIVVFVLIIVLGLISPHNTSTQNAQISAPPSDTHISSAVVPAATPTKTPYSFQEKLQSEINDQNLNGKNGYVTYDPESKTMTFVQTEDDNFGSLMIGEICMDAAHVLVVAERYPNEIKTVTIDLKAHMVDQNRNDVTSTVCKAVFSTENTNPVNWGNTYGDDQYYLLHEKADNFWIDPAFSRV